MNRSTGSIRTRGMFRAVTAAAFGALVLMFSACGPDTDAELGSNEYIVAFNKGGASGEPPKTMTVSRGTSVALPGQGGMKKGGEFFFGWTDGYNNYSAGYDADGGYLGFSTYTVTRNVLLTARWSDGYVVTFDLNGADGTPPPKQTAAPNTGITLPGAERDGYSLFGWNTSENGTGANYNAGASYTVGNGNVTLYARWIPIRAVTFNANGATGGAAPSAMPQDSGKTVTLPARPDGLLRDGYEFAGWNFTADNEDGAITGSANGAYAVGATITVIRDTTLYADWRKTYTLTYDGNGAAGDIPAGVTRGAGLTVTLPGQGGMTLDGYLLRGWMVDDPETGTLYNTGAAYTMPARDVALYAVWTLSGTVVFNANGGGTAPASVTAASGTSITLPSMTRSGYNFNGWNTNSSGTGTNYNSGASYTVPAGTTTLYARWVSTTPATGYIRITNNSPYTITRIDNTTTNTHWVVTSTGAVYTIAPSTTSGSLSQAPGTYNLRMSYNIGASTYYYYKTVTVYSGQTAYVTVP